ncbi:hypothetical protein OMR07_18125 [Methylobacterium organophilum]|nr:hypothetical protein [Methylobacterium organophilum]
MRVHRCPNQPRHAREIDLGPVPCQERDADRREILGLERALDAIADDVCAELIPLARWQAVEREDGARPAILVADDRIIFARVRCARDLPHRDRFGDRTIAHLT